ncbi:MAG: lipoprotein [Paludibacteraceae bacterium]
MKRIIYILLAVALLTSCSGFGNKKTEVEKLKAENDSLQNAKVLLEQEVNDYFATLNDVQLNIEKIKNAQNVLSFNPLSENSPQDVRKKVNEDMAYIHELIRANQEELENLRGRLKRSSFKLGDVEKTLATLTKQLNEESAKVARLQKQLVRKDSVITTLGTQVDSLGKNVEELAQQNETKKQVIQEQDQTIHSAWYAVGSKRELKDNKIVSSDGLFSAQKILQSDFNKNYFVKVDARNTRTIPLYSTSKARILTNHPKNSYTIEKEEDDYVVVINNPSQFWSISKYLVVEVE